MKYLFGLILCICISRMAYTQTTSDYRLRIVDEESGNPLPGATVQFTDINLATIADAEGRFALTRFLPVPIPLK